ncbi:DNA-directed RNA polymerase I subunit RPA43-like [Scaptodrosophila lebanonensis]|uniref:DNA-directed RNA polymerase I subunit RPA43-like n=1 Tax=Drosophila lebanonensis TaxID=7225 RepID=A0A6J2U3N1_DROLE|nr:DNA-directed RNA polymerase I subunit RPA43-like [Scaptodrosophila lebanonensis]
MANIVQKYINFSKKELEQLALNSDSCVRHVNTDMHLSMMPYALADFKHALHELLIRTKVGIYDAKLNGIVLGIKNIKLLGNSAALRADDPAIHLLINADFYVFRPEAGAVLSGTVRHISKHQVSVVLYRVFNTKIRFTNRRMHERITMEQDIKFRIKDFNISNVMPFIEGELLMEENEQQSELLNICVKSKSPEQAEENPNLELNGLVELIKAEPLFEDTEKANKKKRPSKRKIAETTGLESPNKIKRIKIGPN